MKFPFHCTLQVYLQPSSVQPDIIFDQFRVTRLHKSSSIRLRSADMTRAVSVGQQQDAIVSSAEPSISTSITSIRITVQVIVIQLLITVFIVLVA
jgi:hypothetical protein